MKKKSIRKLTRIEGDGQVELIRENGIVTDARFVISEGVRLFEALLAGRSFHEVPDMVCRICSICSTVHKVAALEAVEEAFGCMVSRQSAILRELAVNGGVIESHALHLYFLALPDYLGVAGFQEMATTAPELLQRGARIKKCGNLIQEIAGGRAVHPFNLVIGGTGSSPRKDSLLSLEDELESVIEDATSAPEIFQAGNDRFPELPVFPFFAVKGESRLSGDTVGLSTGELMTAASFRSWLGESAQEGSCAKVCNFGNSGIFVTGPSARRGIENMLDETSSPRDLSDDRKSPRQTVSPYLFNLHRAIELQQSLDRALMLVRLLLEEGIHEEKALRLAPRKSEVTKVIEAPRGTLLHHYEFDRDGVCICADITTPTAMNQAAVGISLRKLVQGMAGAGYGEIRSGCERLVRCFDPCLSCAVH